LGVGGRTGPGVFSVPFFVVLFGMLATAARPGSRGRLAGRTLSFIFFIHLTRLINYLIIKYEKIIF
jgi:hypothetical protein